MDWHLISIVAVLGVMCGIFGAAFALLLPVITKDMDQVITGGLEEGVDTPAPTSKPVDDKRFLKWPYTSQPGRKTSSRPAAPPKGN